MISLIALAIAIGLSYFHYFHKAANGPFGKSQKIILFVLRFTGIFSLFFLLLSPVIEKTIRIKQLPILAVAYDNSLSVSDFQNNFEKLKSSIKSKFSESFKIEFWSYGETSKKTEEYTGADRKSDYGDLIKSIENNYFNQNMGAVLLVGDGLHNYGQNPADLIYKITFPIYTIGIGDTTKKTDAHIVNVQTNSTVYLNNRFPVEVEFKFFKMKNKLVNYDVENNGKTIYSGSIQINSDDFFKLEVLSLEAAKPGLQHYRIKIRAIDGELNIANNEFNFAIKVIENKQKILIVSDGPHPDLGVITSSLDELQNYKTNLVTGIMQLDSISNYSLIIINQLPTKANNSAGLFIKIAEGRIPVLFIVGPQTIANQISSFNIGVEISESENTEEVQAKVNNDFAPFFLSQQAKDLFLTAPPLLSLFGTIKTSAHLDILANQRIRNIETSKPLFSFGSINGRKTGFILGEGLWRWKLHNYKETGNHEAFNELIQKSIQFLALKENEDNFNIYHKSIFKESEEIEFTAELFNDSFEPVSNSEISLVINNDSLQEFNYIFDKQEINYKLNAGTLFPGNYSYKAETNIGNQNYTEQGNFSIIKNELEVKNMPADFTVLYQIASQTAGDFNTFDNYGMLLDEIFNNKQIKVQQIRQTKQFELINVNLMFIIMIVLFGLEWFLRKYWGNY